MKRKAEERWQDVEVGIPQRLDGMPLGVICLTGGLCAGQDGAAGFALDCEHRKLDLLSDETYSFVPVSKQRLWVLKVVGGPSAVKGDFKFSNILNDVAAKLRSGEGECAMGILTPPKTVPAAAGAAAAEDPMGALVRASKTGVVAKTPEKRKGFARGSCVKVTVPMSPKPEETQTKSIVVYQNKRGVLFFAGQDLPWLMRYMYDELEGKRVPEPVDDDGFEDDLDETRPWTARWCPSGTWTVEVTAGPLAGQKWASTVHGMTKEKWATGAALTNVTTPFDQASRGQQKEVLLAFLEDVVQKAIAQEAEL